MKFLSIPIASVLILVAQVHANSYYVPSRNVTCAVDGKGDITCEPGHLNNAPEYTFEAEGTETPAIRGREANPLDKRVTCNLDGATEGLSCFTHCFAQGYCNSHCDSSNICHCSCYDKSRWWQIPCSKTTCSA